MGCAVKQLVSVPVWLYVGGWRCQEAVPVTWRCMTRLKFDGNILTGPCVEMVGSTRCNGLQVALLGVSRVTRFECRHQQSTEQSTAATSPRFAWDWPPF